jgi:hypothetical protein
LVLRLNQETVTTGFEAKPEKPSQWFLVLWLNQETCAPRLHVHGAYRT